MRILSFLASVGFLFLKSYKEGTEPVAVTTADLTTSIDENPSNGDVIGTVTGSTNQGSVWVSGGSKNNGIHTDIWKSN